jgi:hypothetical protein
MVSAYPPAVARMNGVIMYKSFCFVPTLQQDTCGLAILLLGSLAIASTPKAKRLVRKVDGFSQSWTIKSVKILHQIFVSTQALGVDVENSQSRL